MENDNKPQNPQNQDQGNQGGNAANVNDQGNAGAQNPDAGNNSGADKGNDDKGGKNIVKEQRDHIKSLESELAQFRNEKKQKEEAEAIKKGEFDTIKKTLESERDDWKNKYDSLVRSQAMQKALLGSGINPKYLDWAGNLIKAQDGVDFDETTGEYIGVNIEALKTSYPEIFQASQATQGGYQVGVPNVSSTAQGANGVSVDLERFSKDRAYRDSLPPETRKAALKQLKL